MNLLKKTILLMSLFCVAMPAQAMDAGNEHMSLSVFDKIVIGARVLKCRWTRENFITYNVLNWMGLSHIEDAKYCIKSIQSNINQKCYERKAEKCQPWIDAACNPDLEVTKALLDKEGYLKEKDHDGNTPLHWAASEGQEEKVKLFLAHGADVHAKTNSGRTALHCAVLHGHERLVKLFLAQGADVNGNPYSNSITPLRLAVDNGRENIVNLLLEHGADVDAGAPLVAAVSGDRLEIVKLLLAHGADVNVCGAPLCEAINRNSVPVIKLLLAHGADVNVNGGAPLCEAINRNSVPVVKLLLDYGANIDGTFNALLWSAMQGHIETVRSILQHACFSPEKKSNESASQARIKEALLVCMRNSLPRDVRNKILSYLPEDTLNQTHCRLAHSYRADLKQLVAQCPLEWFLRMYDAILPGHKTEFFTSMVSVITEYRMGKVRELLADQRLQELNPATIDPVILAMLDVANIEQHRAAIEQNVRKAFTSRILRKYPQLELVDVDADLIKSYADLEDVISNGLQKNVARD